MTSKRDPYILILSHALTGHITPMLSVAGALLSRGWDVGFLGPTTHRAKIGSAGCEFFSLRGKADIDDSLGTPAALGDGGTRRTKQLFLEGVNYTCHDSILQFGLESFEYPRDDWPAGRFHFIGLPPPKGRRGVSEAEVRDVPWWEGFVANAELPGRDPTRSKVVIVTQGTVEADATELIVPTLQAATRLAQEESLKLFLVVILGVRNASLPPSVCTVPPNVGVVDYLRYGAVLPYADVWVHNGGYGAVSQGIAEGVPMIVAGEGQDKAENARRVAWSGIGLDLKTARPTAEQVANSILEVLRDGSQYRDKVNDMQSQLKLYNFEETVDREVRKQIVI